MTRERRAPETPYEFLVEAKRKVQRIRRDELTLVHLENKYGGAMNGELHRKVTAAIENEAKEFVDTLYESVQKLQAPEICRALGI